MAKNQNFDALIRQAVPNIRASDILNPLKYSEFQRILLFVIVLSSLCFVVYFSGDVLTPSSSSRPSQFDPINPGTGKDSLALPPLEDIVKKMESRKLFLEGKKVAPKISVVKRPVKTVRKGPGITQKIRMLTLLGLINDQPMQAIIEYKRTREVYYVQPGDSIQDMEVVSITSQGHVTIRYKDETMILK